MLSVSHIFTTSQGRWAEEDEEEPAVKVRPVGGVAIAPPPSLQESSEAVPILLNKPPTTNNYGGSVAAKIMARYGFKEGQGLGRMEQGMSSALQVSKSFLNISIWLLGGLKNEFLVWYLILKINICVSDSFL